MEYWQAYWSKIIRLLKFLSIFCVKLYFAQKLKEHLNFSQKRNQLWISITSIQIIVELLDGSYANSKLASFLRKI